VVAGAVLVCGVATLAGTTLQAAESGPVAGVSSTPFTFDSPTATLQHVKPTAAPERATAKADTLVLGDWKFTQTEVDSAEILFLAAVFVIDPEWLPAMTVMVLFPGFTEFVQGLSGGNLLLEFIIIDIIATIILGGENPIKPDAVTPPVSPTT